MRKIQFVPGTLMCSEYHNVLESKIADICHKIGFDDSPVTWWIFDPTNGSSNILLKKVHIGKHGINYGYCYPHSNEIFISTLTLQKHLQEQALKKRNNIVSFTCSSEVKDILTKVLIDEITHIQTKCGHNTPSYDKKYHDNFSRYSNSFCATLSYK